MTEIDEVIKEVAESGHLNGVDADDPHGLRKEVENLHRAIEILKNQCLKFKAILLLVGFQVHKDDLDEALAEVEELLK